MINPYLRPFVSYLDAEGIHYDIPDENVVRIHFAGENMPGIMIVVVFDDDGDNWAELACSGIGRFKDQKFAPGLFLCNQLNNKYRYVKFHIDEEKDVIVRGDCHMNPATAPQDCMEMVNLLASLVDDSYPEFMRILWG